MESNPPNPSPPPDSPLPGDDPIPSRGSFQRPADYYSTPPTQPAAGKGGCSGRAPLTCGAIGCLFLILLFVGGAVVMRTGGQKLFSFAFGILEGEANKAMTASVTPVQKSAFDEEFALLQRNVEKRLIGPAQLQAYFSSMVEATSDNSLTPEEVDSLTEQMKQLNNAAAEKSKSAKGPKA